MGWFSQKKPQPSPTEWLVPLRPVVYPSGIAVITDKGTFFINKDGKRYRVVSQAILESWNFPLLVVTTEAALANYPIAVTKLGFRDGTLLHNIADGKMYLVSESKLRHITNPSMFEILGKKPSDCVTVSASDISIMKLGEPIT